MEPYRRMREEHLIREFIAEAEEHLQVLEPQLLQLEREPNNAALIQDIFVATHAIKGTASYVGLRHVSEFTHLLESVLDRIRQGEMHASPNVIDGLLQGIDGVKQLIQHVAAGKTAPNLSNIERTLVGLHTPSSLPSSSKTNPSQGSQEPLFSADELLTLDQEDIEIFADIANQQLEAMRLSSEQIRHALHQEASSSSSPLESAAAAIVKAFGTIQSSASMLPLASLQVMLQEQGKEIIPFNDPESVSEHHLEGLVHAIERLHQLVTIFFESIGLSAGASQPPLSDLLPVPSGEFLVDSLVTPHMLRVDAKRVDTLLNLVGELVVTRSRLIQAYDLINTCHEDLQTGTAVWLKPPPASRKQALHLFKTLKDILDETTTDLGRLSNQLQEGAMRIRMIPISQVLSHFPRMVRDLSRQSGKEVTLEIHGAETELDKSVVDKLADPLIHLLRNAIDHGVEFPDERRALGKPPQGKIIIAASHHGNQVVITLQDDGQGIDVERVKQKAVTQQLLTAAEAEALSATDAAALIFQTGLSTRDTASHLSGRGVGLHLVKRYIEQLSGTIELRTEPGKGSVFIVKLPLTLAIIPALIVGVKTEIFAIPLVAVEEAVRITDHDINTIESHAVIRFRGKTIPLIHLSAVLGEAQSEEIFTGGRLRESQLPEIEETPEKTSEDQIDEAGIDQDHALITAVVISDGKQELGVIIDRLIGESDIVITALDHELITVEGVSGASIQPDGRVALVLDGAALIQLASMRAHERSSRA